MPIYLKQRWNAYTDLDPVTYAVWAIYENAKVFYLEGRYGDLFSFRKLQDAGFHLWYSTINHFFNQFESTTSIATLVPQCEGVVLELGPGMGNQIVRYDKNKVTRVIGVESNPHFRPDIEAQAEKAGLGGVYELVTCGAEESDVLERNGIGASSMDTVLSIQVLCSVRDEKAMAREIYRVLKPGGKFIFWEHHVSSDWITRLYQNVTNPIWRRLIGGCCRNKDMYAALAAAGQWENFESIEGDADPGKPWVTLPRMWGVLVKAKE
ncbi:Methyltransferase type 11 [Akanthomyces lecanii RCEF 1005]|uniref:Methyltransferase type 11 n=1 Tax=Akanthomyces lecanii RCEF 1005 TaxID=1081108 RepID=A0A168GTZ9_CORDF|nr:Methyltransferase type 11 [Akanthomyces lecanii RCEF 1005]